MKQKVSMLDTGCSQSYQESKANEKCLLSKTLAKSFLSKLGAENGSLMLKQYGKAPLGCAVLSSARLEIEIPEEEFAVKVKNHRFILNLRA